MFKVYKITRLLPIFIVMMLSACAVPNSIHFDMTEEQKAQVRANRAYTAQLQQEDRDRNHIERMRRAEAAELATRNMPDSVSITNNTSNTLVTPLW